MRIANILWFYLIGALLIPGRPVYTILYFLGGVYLLARASLEHSFKRLEVERTLSDQRIFLGESVTVTLRFRNTTAMSLPWLQVVESRPAQMTGQPHSHIATMGPGSVVETSYALLGTKRGRYTVGPVTLFAGDPFGFARTNATVQSTAQFTVYPKVSPLPDLGLPARLPMGDLATRRRLFEDPAWLTGTREYVPGDSMKRIHWNATARTGDLMVKQFRHAMLLPCAIFLNLNRDDFGNKAYWLDSELAISATASLCHHLVEQKQQVALVTNGVDPDDTGAAGISRLPLRQGRGAMVEVLELLARIQEGSGASFARTLAEEAQHLPWGTLLCIVTPRETPEVATVCARLGRSGQQVLLFVTDGGTTRSGRRTGYQVLELTDNRGEVGVG